MKLTPQQEFAVNKFSKQKVAALFMEMGTGKTLTAMTLANMHADKVDCIVWMAPLSTIQNTKTEIDKQGGLKSPTLFVGYETIAQSDRQYLKLLDRLKGKRIFLVCDESLFLKNGETKRWNRVNHIRSEFAEFCILLNGTPMSRDEMDIYWQMRLLSPLVFKMTENEYRSVLFTKVILKKPGQNQKIFFKRCQTNIAWLKAKLAPYVYECDLRLPVALNETQTYLSLSPATAAEYQEAKQRLLSAIKDYNEIVIMGCLSAMKHLVSADIEKNAHIASLVNGTNTLVFCEYREEQAQIVDALKGNAYVINGDTPISERDEIIRNWASDQRPLVTMTACSSFGLNLQASNRVVFASLPWDYATYTQALHRVYRTGQKSSTIEINQILQKCGIANMVEECLWKKTTLAEYVKTIDWREYAE